MKSKISNLGFQILRMRFQNSKLGFRIYKMRSEISNFKSEISCPPGVKLGPMKVTRREIHPALALLPVAAFLLFTSLLAAQSGETFKARLSPVPINVSMLSTVAGTGSLTATLNGKKLTIQGTFEGLRSPATTVQIHRSPKGIPGPSILDLMVTKAEKGTVSGTVDLSPDQIEDLRNGRLYVQIQSQGAPDGNLWGWLLK
jgi:CHRD domain